VPQPTASPRAPEAYEGVTYKISFTLQAETGRNAGLCIEWAFREQRRTTLELKLLTTVLVKLKGAPVESSSGAKSR
jgi:hypothetical protein